MTYEQCARCGYGNEAGAGVCVNCGSQLDAGPLPSALAYAAPPAAAYAAREAPAGTLPLDFPARGFDTVGDVFGPTFRLYREHLGTVAKIVLVAVPAQAVFEYAAAMPADDVALPPLLAWLASNAVGAVVMGALVHAVMTLLRTGASPPLKESFAWALRKWWKLILCLLLTTVAVGVGTLMLCIPGIILAVVFAVALPAVAVEDLGPVAALRRSVMLTKGYRGLVFVTMLVMGLLLVAAIGLITATSTPPSGAGSQLLMSLVYAGVTQLLYSINTALMLFTYLSLRTSHGDVDAPAALTHAPFDGQLP